MTDLCEKNQVYLQLTYLMETSIRFMICPKHLLLFCFIGSFIGLQAQKTISGNITDENGAPLAGATLKIRGTTTATVSDADGQFSLFVEGDSTIILEATYIGFLTELITVSHQSYIDIQMEPGSTELDQIVIIGYGTQSRRRLTNSIVKVEEEAYEGIPATTFEDGLQGRLPGVVFTKGSGALGADVSIRVRGVASVNAENQPLFVIDGLIYEGLQGFSLGSGTSSNPLINLNPNDIASVEVLKDGAASAIYGSRGSNGVILITTKRGKFNAKPKVNLQYYAGFSEPTNTFDLLSGPEFAEFWNQAARNVGLDERSGLLFDNSDVPDTDWQDVLMRKGFQHQTSASVAGGTENTRYYFGGTYRDENSYFLATNLKRYSFRANIDQRINDLVQAGININPSITNNDRAYEGFSLQAPNSLGPGTWPTLAPFDEDGEPLPTLISQQGIPFGSPLVNLLEGNTNTTTTQVLLSTYAEYRPWNFLKFRTEFGVEYTHTLDLVRNSSRTSFGRNGNGSGSTRSQQLVNYNWTVLGSYTNSFANKHDLEVTFGSNLTERLITFQLASGNNFSDDRLTYLNAATNTEGLSGRTEARFAGFFARANYVFDNQFLLTLSGRYDGASRFGSEKRFGFFPAASAGWILTESVLTPSKVLDYLKIRASVGQSGNAGLFDFAGLGLVESVSYNGEAGFILEQLENQDLQWEQTLQTDLGLDFELWNSRLRGSVGYFIKDTKDLLFNVPLPHTSGISFSFQNTGQIRNQGFEFDLSADLLKGPFQWTLSLNGATLKNEIRRLPDNDGNGRDDDIVNGRYIFRTGQSISSWYLVEYAGVDPSNGDALYFDLEGNTVPLRPPFSARSIVGNSIPDFTGGFTNSFNYKNFDLSIFFQWARGFQKYRQEGEFWESNLGQPNNQLRSQLDAWTPDNTETDVPQARLQQINGHLVSTRYLDDADFIRLKNIQLGYTIRGIGKTGNRIRVYASAQNLLTFTAYKGLDPEGENFNNFGPLSGTSIFNSTLPKTILFGLNAEF